MKNFIFLFSLLIVQLNAQNIFHDDFDSYGGQLNGQGTWSNDPANGGLGNCVGPGCVNSLILPNFMSYIGYGSADNSLEIVPNKDGVGTTFPVVKSGDIFVSFVMNLSNAQTNDNSDFFRVMSLSNLTTTYRLYVITDSMGGFKIGAAKGANGNPISFTAKSFNYNKDHLIVTKYTQLPGTSDDVLTIFIDPTFKAGEPVTPDAIVLSGFDQSGDIDRLAFRTNWTKGMPTGRVALPSVAKTWATLKYSGVATQDLQDDQFKWLKNDLENGLILLDATNKIINPIIEIYDVLGRLVESRKTNIDSGINNIQVNPITNPGIYVIKIVSNNDLMSVQKALVH